VIRVSGARLGGESAAWAISAGAAYAFTSTPNPDSLTVPWGADEHLFIALFAANGDGEAVTANPSGYTAGADGDTAAGYTVGSAYRTSSSATEDPGTFTIAGDENVLAWTFCYRAVEDTSGDGVLDITGNLDARIELSLTEDLVDVFEGSQNTPMAYKSSGNNGWGWEIYNFLGELHSTFWWYDSGGSYHTYDTLNSGTYLPWTVNYERIALRVFLDVDDGASDSVCTWYYSDAIDGSWTTIATASGEGVTSIKSNDADLLVAGNDFVNLTSYSLAGRLYAFELRDDTTVVANPDLTAQTVGDTSFVDAAGRTWTVGAGGAITDMMWRFYGELASLPVRWDVTGKNITSPVEAAGLFRRLRQGNRRLTSAIRRAIVADKTGAALVQYWPIEESGDQVTRFGADIGSAPFQVSGGFPKAGSISGFVASDAIADPDGTTWTADVDTYSPILDEWQIRWLQSIPATYTIGTAATLVEVTTTDMVWRVRYSDTGSFQLTASRGGTTVYSSSVFDFDAEGKDLRMTLDVSQNGSSVDVALKGQQAGETAAGGFSTSSVVTGSAGLVTRIRINPDGDPDISGIGIGHVTLGRLIQSDGSLVTPLNAYDGEKAAVRIARLCAEEGLATRIVGDPRETEAMGPQRAGTLISLLEECADTDLGILFEARESLAIGYRTRDSMLDQPVALALDYSAGEVAGGLQPDRDDQGFRNDVTVRNASGSVARSVLDDGSSLSISPPPVGAGSYDTEFAVNGQDSRLQELADTRLALSTVDQPRLSSMVLALETLPMQADAALRASVLALRLGDLATIDNLPTQVFGATQLRQLVQGASELITPYRHQFDLLTSPSDPWESGGGVVDPPESHSVSYRTQQELSTPGTPAHVLTALGYTDTAKIARADLDDILDDWVASTGGATRTVTSAAEWTTAVGAANPGDLIRVTSSFDPGGALTARASKYGISGSNMVDGEPGLPIILTCADGVNVDDNNQSSNTAVLDLANCSHIWAVGFNVRRGQFGIRASNWGGSDGFPAYIAYCNVELIGDAGITALGWFQLITSSGGTPPAGTGNEWGFSEWFVIEENFVDGCGQRDANFGEGLYIGKGSPGYVGYAKNAWIRGNRLTDWTSDGIDVKPGCSRVYVTDNEVYIGHAVSGSPVSLLYNGDAGGVDRPAWNDFDPEIYLEGNRIFDNDITNTDASSAEWMVTIGLSGVRCFGNVIWAWPSGSAAFRARMAIGADDTEAEDFYRTDPTWIVNNTCWGADSFDPAGYGPSPLTAWPSAVLAIFDVRNNIVDNASPATGEVDAAASDFIAAVPAVGVAGTAEWLTYGAGSAFDLALDSDLVGSGEDISDVVFLIQKDVSNRDINYSAPNPGAFQPHPANL
jgi:hypothetical protein